MNCMIVGKWIFLRGTDCKIWNCLKQEDNACITMIRFYVDTEYM